MRFYGGGGTRNRTRVSFHAAFEFLHDAGVIRLLRTSNQPRLEQAMKAIWVEGSQPARGGSTPILRRSFEAIEQDSGMSDFVAYLSTDRRAVYHQVTTSQKYEMFLIEDIMMLLCCAMTPSQSVFECLEQRYMAFREPSDLTTVRRFRDMCRVSLRYWRQRLESDNWQVDSLGTPLLSSAVP